MNALQINKPAGLTLTVLSCLILIMYSQTKTEYLFWFAVAASAFLIVPVINYYNAFVEKKDRKLRQCMAMIYLILAILMTITLFVFY